MRCGTRKNVIGKLAISSSTICAGIFQAAQLSRGDRANRNSGQANRGNDDHLQPNVREES